MHAKLTHFLIASGLTLLALTSHSATLDNALVITMNDGKTNNQTIVKKNTLYQLSNGKVIMKAVQGGDCTVYMPQQGSKIVEKCSEFGEKARLAAEKMTAAMGVTKEQMAMMQNLVGKSNPQALSKTGTETIGGVSADCYANDSRRICVSKSLEDRVKKEGFDGRSMVKDMMKSLQDLTGKKLDDPAEKVLQLGFPVLDMHKSSGRPPIPGWDLLDEATKQNILARMGNSNGGNQGEKGAKLVSVNRESATINEPDLPASTVDQAMNRMMQSGFKR